MTRIEVVALIQSNSIAIERVLQHPRLIPPTIANYTAIMHHLSLLILNPLLSVPGYLLPVSDNHQSDI